MRENRLYGSEGGEANAFPTPYRLFSVFQYLDTSSRKPSGLRGSSLSHVMSIIGVFTNDLISKQTRLSIRLYLMQSSRRNRRPERFMSHVQFFLLHTDVI